MRQSPRFIKLFLIISILAHSIAQNNDVNIQSGYEEQAPVNPSLNQIPQEQIPPNIQPLQQPPVPQQTHIPQQVHIQQSETPPKPPPQQQPPAQQQPPPHQKPMEQQPHVSQQEYVQQQHVPQQQTSPQQQENMQQQPPQQQQKPVKQQQHLPQEQHVPQKPTISQQNEPQQPSQQQHLSQQQSINSHDQNNLLPEKVLTPPPLQPPSPSIHKPIHNQPPIPQSGTFEQKPHMHGQIPNKPSKKQQAQVRTPPKQPTFQQNPSRTQQVFHNDVELDYIMRIPSPQIEEDNGGHFFSSSKHFVSMTVIVRPSGKDCYFYEPETHFDVDFQVLRGDKLDIGLIVIDPIGTPVVLRAAVGEGATPIHVLPEFRRRPFAVCLDNRKASHGEKTVFLAIDLHINWQNPTDEDINLMNSINFRIAKEPGREELRQHIENLERMSTNVDRIGTLLHRAQRLQQRSRNKASVDRVLMESTRQHITAWSTFQLFLMLCVGIIQTLLIRSLFDERSSFYRLWVHGSSNAQKFTHSAPRF